MTEPHCRIGKTTWKSARIYTMPGVERRDIGFSPTVERVINGAIEAGISAVVLVGIDRKGNLYVAGSPPSADTAVGMMMRGVQYLAGATMTPLKGARLDEE